MRVEVEAGAEGLAQPGLPVRREGPAGRARLVLRSAGREARQHCKGGASRQGGGLARRARALPSARACACADCRARGPGCHWRERPPLAPEASRRAVCQTAGTARSCARSRSAGLRPPVAAASRPTAVREPPDASERGRRPARRRDRALRPARCLFSLPICPPPGPPPPPRGLPHRFAAAACGARARARTGAGPGGESGS